MYIYYIYVLYNIHYTSIEYIIDYRVSIAYMKLRDIELLHTIQTYILHIILVMHTYTKIIYKSFYQCVQIIRKVQGTIACIFFY